MRFFNLLLILALLGVSSQSIGQQVQIYYSDATILRIVDRPIYDYHLDLGSHKVIKVTDSAFVNFLLGIVDTLQPDSIIRRANLGTCPVHIILEKEEWGEFYTIDLELSISAESYSSGSLWVDGKRKLFSPKFQQIIDDIVKSKILQNTDVNDTSFLNSIIVGNGLKLELFRIELPSLDDLDD